MLGFVTIVCMNLTHLCPENQPSSWYIIILTVLLIIVMDTLSGWLRRRLIHGRRPRFIDPGSEWRLHRHWYEHSETNEIGDPA